MNFCYSRYEKVKWHRVRSDKRAFYRVTSVFILSDLTKGCTLQISRKKNNFKGDQKV